ncbi:MAG: hypothetical protein ACR2MN_09145 [Acidimicrobiales bacterium]
MAFDEELAPPLVAVPMAADLLVAVPELPPLPDSPDVVARGPPAAPEPPPPAGAWLGSAPPAATAGRSAGCTELVSSGADEAPRLRPENPLPVSVPAKPLPLLPPPVFPLVELSVLEEDPVEPDAPPGPLEALPEAEGLDMAAPVDPPVDDELVGAAPVLPEVVVALPPTVDEPDAPPVAAPLAAPDEPLLALLATPPLPPPPLVLADPDVDPPLPAPAPPPVPPVEPLTGDETPAPPLPLVLLLVPVDVAAPLEPLVPPLAFEVELAEPEVALELEVELLLPAPELPPAFELPLVVVLAFWETAEAGGVGGSGGGGAWVCNDAARAKLLRRPDMGDNQAQSEGKSK